MSNTEETITIPTSSFNDHLVPRQHQEMEEVLATLCNAVLLAAVGEGHDLPVDDIRFRMCDHIDSECGEWRYEDGFSNPLVRVTWEKDVELRVLTFEEGIWHVIHRHQL